LCLIYLIIEHHPRTHTSSIFHPRSRFSFFKHRQHRIASSTFPSINKSTAVIMDSNDNQLTGSQSAVASIPHDLMTLLDEHLKQSLLAYHTELVNKLASDVAKQLYLEKKEFEAANTQLRNGLMEHKQAIQNTVNEVTQNTIKTDTEVHKIHNRQAETDRKTEAIKRDVAGLSKIVDPKRIAKNEKTLGQQWKDLQKQKEDLQKQKDNVKKQEEELEKQQKEIPDQREEIAALKEGHTEMVTMFRRMALGQNVMAEMRAFIASMEGKPGSLFRDGLVIPEDDGTLDYGDDDEDGDLKIIL
ncbi:hypothetical protein GE09DRAFT_1250651, partial [Coniochaeta sp. 2T2.1]